MRTEVAEEPAMIARAAGTDLGKAELVCCVRLPGRPGRRTQEVTTRTTMTGSLSALADQLVAPGAEQVWTESTSDYWRPIYYQLEAHGLAVFLTNAKQARHLPGRPKTDAEDGVWLCKPAERGMLRASFVPPAPIEGTRDPVVPAEMAKAGLRSKKARLAEALTGFFTDEHAVRLQISLDVIDTMSRHTASLDQEIARALEPYRREADQVLGVPGVQDAAAAIIAEAVTATSRTILVGLWHVLSDPDACWTDEALGRARRQDPERAARPHIAALEQLGYTITAPQA